MSNSFLTPWVVACQAPLSMKFSRQESWSGLPSSSAEDLPNPGIEPKSPTLQEDSLLSEPPVKSKMAKTNSNYLKELQWWLNELRYIPIMEECLANISILYSFWYFDSFCPLCKSFLPLDCQVGILFYSSLYPQHLKHKRKLSQYLLNCWIKLFQPDWQTHYSSSQHLTHLCLLSLLSFPIPHLPSLLLFIFILLLLFPPNPPPPVFT